MLGVAPSGCPRDALGVREEGYRGMCHVDAPHISGEGQGGVVSVQWGWTIGVSRDVSWGPKCAQRAAGEHWGEPMEVA